MLGLMAEKSPVTRIKTIDAKCTFFLPNVSDNCNSVTYVANKKLLATGPDWCRNIYGTYT